MRYEDFQRQVGRAGLSIREFAELLRMNPNSVTNYAGRGEIPSHLAVIATLMGELAERRIDFRSVVGRIEIGAKRPRGGPSRGRFAGRASR